MTKLTSKIPSVNFSAAHDRLCCNNLSPVQCISHRQIKRQLAHLRRTLLVEKYGCNRHQYTEASGE